MSAQCLVEELLFGMPSDDNPEPGELLDAEEAVSRDLVADDHTDNLELLEAEETVSTDRSDHPDEQGHVRTDEAGVNITINNKNSRNMNEKAEDTDNCSLDSDDYLQQPAETQPRVMKKRTRTTKSRANIILPQGKQSQPRHLMVWNILLSKLIEVVLKLNLSFFFSWFIDWREKPRSQLREELLGQNLDVDIGSRWVTS